MKPRFSRKIICLQFIESQDSSGQQHWALTGHYVSTDLEMGQAPGFLQLDRAV
jgi:hypothetical protein